MPTYKGPQARSLAIGFEAWISSRDHAGDRWRRPRGHCAGADRGAVPRGRPPRFARTSRCSCSHPAPRGSSICTASRPVQARSRSSSCQGRAHRDDVRRPGAAARVAGVSRVRQHGRGGRRRRSGSGASPSIGSTHEEVERDRQGHAARDHQGAARRDHDGRVRLPGVPGVSRAGDGPPPARARRAAAGRRRGARPREPHGDDADARVRGRPRGRYAARADPRQSGGAARCPAGLTRGAGRPDDPRAGRPPARRGPGLPPRRPRQHARAGARWPPRRWRRRCAT
jgi:hypothetical protein